VSEAIAKLKCKISGRQLEKLLRISQGYLSRVKSGKGTPSEPLFALLALLAADPNRVGELERLWAVLLPVTDG
jgi:transcriptional regulator with XRE-family HTH domain